MGGQVVKEDALRDTGLNGHSVILLVYLDWKVGRHIDGIYGVLNPACPTPQLTCSEYNPQVAAG